MIPILSIVGRSNSGKTTLLEKLIPELRRRGYTLGTIKHHSRGPVAVDTPGKDSWRHKRAGARTAGLVSCDSLFVVSDTEKEWSLEAIACLPLLEVDLLLAEGFKSSSTPKIEVIRTPPGGPPLCGTEDGLVAVVSDAPTPVPVPHFGLEEIGPLAEFIQREFLADLCPPPVDVLVGGQRVVLDEATAEVLARTVRSLIGGADPGGGPPIALRIRGRTQ